MPVEPPPTVWRLPEPHLAREGDLLGVGADLDPGTLLAAYRSGLFPMPVQDRLGWWSPDPRAVLPLDELVISKSLHRSCARFEIRVDTSFDEVVAACADPSRPHGWITDEICAAYATLHRLGWAHSVEAWCEGSLAGGLYGVGIGALFAGESMFHRVTDASKVALVALVEMLRGGGATLLDVQWQTDHLASLGVVEIPRPAYLERLHDAIAQPTIHLTPRTSR